MIKSMTGFAALAREDEQGSVSVTIRSVNHRFLDLQLRVPASLGEAEARLRALVQKRLARGRVEVSLSLQMRHASTPSVELNAEFARALAAVMEEARASGLVSGELTPGDLLRLPQALTIRDRSPDASGPGDAVQALAEMAVDAAIDQLEAMRVREGAHLRTDFDARKTLLGELIGRVTAAAEQGRTELEARLLERARDLGATLPIDQAALAQEVVRVAQDRKSVV